MNEMNFDKNFYCSSGVCVQSGVNAHCVCRKHDCCNLRRKHPTPEQFKQEYGFEWTGAVYYHCTINNDCDGSKLCNPKGWMTEELGCLHEPIIVCACTPFGKPDDDWRPSGMEGCNNDNRI